MGRGQGHSVQAAVGLRRAGAAGHDEFLPGASLNDVLFSGEIGRFVGREAWPAAQEWEDAGQHRLYVKMMGSGGPRRWATWIHVPYEPSTLDERRRERVRVQLTQFMDGRTHWPEAQEFAAAGQQRLHALMLKAGGEDLWAEIFGFPTREQREFLALMDAVGDRQRVRSRRT